MELYHKKAVVHVGVALCREGFGGEVWHVRFRIVREAGGVFLWFVRREIFEEHSFQAGAHLRLKLSSVSTDFYFLIVVPRILEVLCKRKGDFLQGKPHNFKGIPPCFEALVCVGAREEDRLLCYLCLLSFFFLSFCLGGRTHFGGGDV